MKIPGAVLAVLAMAPPSSGEVKALPPALLRQLPQHYLVLTYVEASNVAGRDFYIVTLASREEHRDFPAERDAPQRPLLIFESTRKGVVRLVGRNDDVVSRATDGGMAGNGCDPFEEKRIVVKGVYFTVENEVACGAHWTDFVTFRFDAGAGGYVFDNSRFESWSLNPSNAADAPALISDGQKLVRAHHPIPFAKWRRTG